MVEQSGEFPNLDTLKSIASDLFKNPKEDEQFRERAQECQVQQLPTLHGVVLQYVTEYAGIIANPVLLPVLRNRFGNDIDAIMDGFTSVVTWLREIKRVQGLSEEALIALEAGNIEDYVDDLEQGKVRPISGQPILKGIGQSSFTIPNPLPRQELRLIKTFLGVDPSGVNALQFIAKRNEPKNMSVLIGVRAGLNRVIAINKGIEQASWGGSNPYTPISNP